MHIRTYLLFWFLAVLVMVGGIFSWFELNAYRSVKNSVIQRETKKFTSLFKTSVSEITQEFSGSLPIYVYKISTNKQNIQDVLSEMRSQYTADWVFAIKGGKYFIYPTVALSKAWYMSEPWYVSAVNSPLKVVENEFHSESLNSNIFTFSVSVSSVPGVVGGIVFKENRFFSMVTAQMGGSSFLIFKDGRVIYPQNLHFKINDDQNQVVTLNGVEYILQWSNYDALMERVGCSSATGYKIAFLIPYAPISANLKKSIGYIVMVFSILISLVMMAFLLSTRKISASIVSLSKITESLDLQEMILNVEPDLEKSVKTFKETEQTYEKIVEMFQDISAHIEELRATNEELESSYEDIENLSNSLAVESSKLRELSESSKLIATASDVNEAATILLDKIISLYHCEGIVLLDVIDGDMKVVQRRGAKFDFPTLSPLKNELMNGKATVVTKDGKHYYVSPVLFGSNPIAIMVMMFGESMPSSGELEYIGNFSTHFASILNSTRMVEKLRESYIYLAQKFSEISEIYDYETGSHVRRVGKYSELVARELGMSDTFIEQIGIYAMIHDIGKLKVPREILMKNGPLTPVEFEEMKKHTIYGEELLGDAPFLEMARHIARSHHEKFDGSGYPDGLRGSEIPIEARIVAIADVYDALRSKRRYKKGYTHEEAYRIITDGDGRTLRQHFDPEILRVFKKCHLEFAKIYDLLGE